MLARAVVPSAALLALHARVHAVLDGEPACGPSVPHLAPGTWTPHVTLARALPAADLSTAVTALGPLPEVVGSGAAVRRWDATRRRTWVLRRLNPAGTAARLPGDGPAAGPVDGEAGMDWIGWAFVLVVVAAAVGVVLERRRRRNRLGGPGHSEDAPRRRARAAAAAG